MGTKFSEEMAIMQGIVFKSKDSAGGGMSVREGNKYKPLRNQMSILQFNAAFKDNGGFEARKEHVLH